MLSLDDRAARYAALGDPVRLTVVDRLINSDRAPQELQRLIGIPSNLLAHHLDVLEGVGLIVRGRSSGDGRRRYVHLLAHALDELGLRPPGDPQPALFVCTANSARSQLAAALWTDLAGAPAASAGTHPAAAVHPGAKAAAKRAGLDLGDATPRHLDDVTERPALVVTVCDRAHEELEPGEAWLHWSIPDPVADGSRAAFDRTVDELRSRIRSLHAA